MATTVTNILTWVGYRLNTSISATSEPTQTEIIQWTNEVCEELLTVCSEFRSEIGRSLASISLADGTASYNNLAALLLAPYSEGNFCGWLEKATSRVPLILGVEGDSIHYNPSAAGEGEPNRFYVDGGNNLVFLPTPDATYTAKIPYYAVHTILTAIGDTVPFVRIFDNVIIESVTMRAQNRDEYDLSFELKWYSYIRQQARKVIAMRRGEVVKIEV